MSSGLFSESTDQAMSVSELTGHLKAVVEQTFPSMWVSGEISDLARPRSGHLYFTLKDDQAQIRGVMWRTTASRLKFDLEDGQAVLCFGNIEVYAARGSYQMIVRKMQPDGVGSLQLAFQQLQAKLQREGLFDADRKRPLPPFPKRVGIITSPTGAALQDFLEATRARYQGAQIVVIPAVVQGNGAVKSIVQGMKAAHEIVPALDLVVLSRGGGSLEDLWSFNDEAVVRAVAMSRLPTVSAIGHEIDVTLCDMAADVRALTPTDAASQIFPETESIKLALGSLQTRLIQATRSGIRQRRLRLEALQERPILRSPMEVLHHRSRLLDEWDARAKRAMDARIHTAQNRIARASSTLSALSPLSVLARGYSVTFGPDNQPLTNANSLQVGDRLRTQMSQGEVESIIESVKPSNNDDASDCIQ